MEIGSGRASTTTATSTGGDPPNDRDGLDDRGGARGDDGSGLLRTVLRVDASSTGVTGAALVVACVPLSELTGMPLAFSLAFGFFQLVGAAMLAWLVRLSTISPALARAVVALNLLSGLGCLAVAVTDMLPLTGFGVVFLLVGAGAVLTFTGLQFLGARRLVQPAEPG